MNLQYYTLSLAIITFFMVLTVLLAIKWIYPPSHITADEVAWANDLTILKIPLPKEVPIRSAQIILTKTDGTDIIGPGIGSDGAPIEFDHILVAFKVSQGHVSGKVRFGISSTTFSFKDAFTPGKKSWKSDIRFKNGRGYFLTDGTSSEFHKYNRVGIELLSD